MPNDTTLPRFSEMTKHQTFRDASPELQQQYITGWMRDFDTEGRKEFGDRWKPEYASKFVREQTKTFGEKVAGVTEAALDYSEPIEKVSKVFALETGALAAQTPGLLADFSVDTAQSIAEVTPGIDRMSVWKWLEKNRPGDKNEVLKELHASAKSMYEKSQEISPLSDETTSFEEKVGQVMEDPVNFKNWRELGRQAFYGAATQAPRYGLMAGLASSGHPHLAAAYMAASVATPKYLDNLKAGMSPKDARLNAYITAGIEYFTEAGGSIKVIQNMGKAAKGSLIHGIFLGAKDIGIETTEEGVAQRLENALDEAFGLDVDPHQGVLEAASGALLMSGGRQAGAKAGSVVSNALAKRRGVKEAEIAPPAEPQAAPEKAPEAPAPISPLATPPEQAPTGQEAKLRTVVEEEATAARERIEQRMAQQEEPAPVLDIQPDVPVKEKTVAPVEKPAVVEAEPVAPVEEIKPKPIVQTKPAQRQKPLEKMTVAQLKTEYRKRTGEVPRTKWKKAELLDNVKRGKVAPAKEGTTDIVEKTMSILDKVEGVEHTPDKLNTATSERDLQEARDTPESKGVRKALEDQAEQAVERMTKRIGGGLKAETPISLVVRSAQDVADLAIYGTSKLALTGLDFAAWSAEMVKDFGDGITENLKEIYDKSSKRLEALEKEHGVVLVKKPVKKETAKEVAPPKQEALKKERKPFEPPATLEEAVEIEQERKYAGVPKDAQPPRAFRNARFESLRKLVDLPGLSKTEKVSFTEIAKTVVASGMVDTVDHIAGKLKADPNRSAEVDESIAMSLRLDELEARVSEISILQSELINDGKATEAEAYTVELEEITSKIDLITSVGGRAGNRAGLLLGVRAYNAARNKLKAEMIVVEATKAKGEKLTVEEAKQFADLKNQMVERDAEILKLTKELDDQQQEMDKAAALANVIRDAKQAKHTRKKVDTDELRKSILAEIAQMGHRVNDITGLAPEFAILIGRLANTYIQDGISDAREIASKLKKDVPDLADRDVFEVLAARKPRAKKRAEKRATKVRRELKKQARLHLQIDDATNGIFTKVSKKQTPASTEVKRLRALLDDLRLSAIRVERDGNRLANILQKIDHVDDQVIGMFRDMKKKQKVDPDDIKEAKAALSEARSFMATNDKLTIIESQIKNKDFDLDPTSRREVKSDRLEFAQVKLRKLRREANTQIENLRPKTFGKKVFNAVAGTGMFLRAMEAMGELSPFGRQGLGLIGHQLVSGTKGWANIAGSFSTGLKSLFSENTADAVQLAIFNHPDQLERNVSGLDLTDFGAPLTKREEGFISRMIELIPGLGWLAKAGSRFQTVFLNLMRIASYDSAVKANPLWKAKERKKWAHTVNALSGRSNWLKKLLTGEGTKISSIIGFAPNFAMSRIEAPARLIWSTLADPALRKESARAMAGFVTVNAIFLALSHLAGGDIGWDEEEFDFLRVSFGDTKIDMMAGFNQPMRVILLGILSGLDEAGMKEMVNKSDFMRAFGNFLTYKQSPLIGAPGQLLFGKDIFDQPKSRIELATRTLSMLYYQEVYDMYHLKDETMDPKTAAFHKAYNRRKARGSKTHTRGMAVGVPLGFLGTSLAVLENELKRPKIRAIYKSKGLSRIDPPKWPDWLKERKNIKRKENNDKVFYGLMAGWLEANQRLIDRMSKKDGSKYIRAYATRLRNAMKEQIGKTEY